MKQLETRVAATQRRLASDRPEWFSHPTPVFQWEMVSFAVAKELGLVDWQDRSYHKTLTCRNHPKSRYTTKNPWDRLVFCHKGASGGDSMFDQECDCPFTDMRLVIM